jgi:thiol-disulfide isomerase/thioredoxin
MDNKIVAEFYKVLESFNQIFKQSNKNNFNDALIKAHILHGKLILLKSKYKKNIHFNPTSDELYILSTLHVLLTSTNKIMEKYDPLPFNNVSQNVMRGGSLTIGKEPTLVLFYAHWCGYCTKFMPIWEKLEKDLDIKTIKINCPENENLCDKYNIQGYPTIKLFKNEQEIDFNKSRTYEGVMEFVKENK